MPVLKRCLLPVVVLLLVLPLPAQQPPAPKPDVPKGAHGDIRDVGQSAAGENPFKPPKAIKGRGWTWGATADLSLDNNAAKPVTFFLRFTLTAPGGAVVGDVTSSVTLQPGQKSEKFGVYCKHDPASKGDYRLDVSLTATEDPDIPGGELRHKQSKYARVP
jgi:hypothetical protein